MEDLLHHFRPEQVLLVMTEDLRHHAATSLSVALSFLGLDPHKVDLDAVTSVQYNVHSGSEARPPGVASVSAGAPADRASPQGVAISLQTKEQLCRELAPHNRALAARLKLERMPWSSCGTAGFTGPKPAQ